MVDGDPVYWATLQPWMAEIAGGTTLQEYAVDRRLERELADRRIVIGPEDLRRERDLLARSMERGVGALSPAGASPDEVARIVAELRQERGLGEARFAALLRRSAGLRRLIQDRVQVTEDAVRQAYLIKYGEKRRARIIVVPTQKQAAELLARLSADGGGANVADMAERFSHAARESSTDPSAPRGGEIEAFSCEDPAYPSVIRQGIGSLSVGQLTSVMALDRGFAIAMLEAVVPGSGTSTGPTETQHSELEADIRLRIERLQMDRAAAELLGRPGVNVMDRSVDWSWRNASKNRP